MSNVHMLGFKNAFSNLLKTIQCTNHELYETMIKDGKSGLMLTLELVALLYLFRWYDYEQEEDLVEYVNVLAEHISQFEEKAPN
jgi:hypothetical protein